MIFGFNTDIKVDGVVYHVQSEVREDDRVLQTQVFVSGRCIGKRDVSFTNCNGGADYTDERKHGMLREQHRWVVESIRNGFVMDVFKASAPGDGASVSQPLDGLQVRFLSSARPSEVLLVMKFHVANGTVNSFGAGVKARIMPDLCAPETFSGGGIAVGNTDADGSVELTLPIPPTARGEANLLVQAVHDGKSATRRFRLKTS